MRLLSPVEQVVPLNEKQNEKNNTYCFNRFRL